MILTELRRRFGRPPAVHVARWKTARRLYGDVNDREVADLARRHPGRAAATIDAAERVCRHEFALLGSGVFVPADPDRPSNGEYEPIDWYLDPVRRLQFPRGIPHKKWDLYAMRPGLADIKYPWELARCQHWVPLGQAFRLTGDERFAREMANELADFMRANPIGLGVNWTCTMDVALRAINWILGLELVRESRTLDDAFWTQALGALFDHGGFIRGNLENTYEVTSNHFLSNVVGLACLGVVFDSTPDGREWSTFARDALEREMTVQVLADGADYESSVPYHRLVAELFLGGARVADAAGRPMSAEYISRLRDMASYLAAVTRPDGLMPQIGDADDGRVQVFSDYAQSTPQDARHLLAAAGAMFGNAEWIAMAGDVAEWESTWWGVPVKALDPAETAPPVTRLFPDAGVAVVRADAVYLVVTNGVVGTKGFGNHKHNDQLSFEFHAGGAPLVVDPGSYVYTSDPGARNLFRGTGYHSTLMVDGIEQNEFKTEWLFRMFDTSHAEHVTFEVHGHLVEYVGRHHGYERLDEPVTHERSFQVNTASGALRIADRLRGRGTHEIRWHFHLAPGVSARTGDGEILLERAGRAAWSMRLPSGLAVDIEPASYSPSYGVRIPASAITLRARIAFAGQHEWTFTFQQA